MNSKLVVNLDSTSLGSASCILNYYRTTVQGYKQVPKASMIYGVAVHKFVDTMFRTGNLGFARKDAERAFNEKKETPRDNQAWLADHRHLITSCFNLWTEHVETDSSFEILQIQTKCYYCDGKGRIFKKNLSIPEDLDGGVAEEDCEQCNGSGTVTGPATEVTFKIPFYEDDFILVNLCGTIDKVGQFKGGCYAIGDWKTTASYKKDDYLSQYEFNRQLRVYTLACKLMAKSHPDSVLGKIGATKMGAFIDAYFLKSKPNENEFQRTQVFQFDESDLRDFNDQLTDFCKQLSKHVEFNYFPKQGLLNGTCIQPYGKCRFWSVCKAPEHIGQLLLKRDYIQKPYDPLNFHE